MREFTNVLVKYASFKKYSRSVDESVDHEGMYERRVEKATDAVNVFLDEKLEAKYYTGASPYGEEEGTTIIDINKAGKRGAAREALVNELKTKFIDPIKDKTNEAVNNLNAIRESEIKKAKLIRLLYVFALATLCISLLQKAFKNPESLINFSSVTSILSNPTLQQVAAIFSYCCVEAFGIQTYLKSSKNAETNGLRVIFSEDVIKNVLETAYQKTDLAKDTAPTR